MSEVVATMSPMPNNSFTSLTKFFKTPKGLLVIALAVLIPLAGAPSGFAVVAPGVAAAAIAAMLIDAPILRYRDKEWSFPSGALLTGLLVAMVLFASRYCLARPFAWAARSSATLMIWSLCWCFFVVAVAHWLHSPGQYSIGAVPVGIRALARWRLHFAD